MPVLLRHVKKAMQKLPRDPREYDVYGIRKFKSLPMVGMKTILYQAVLRSRSKVKVPRKKTADQKKHSFREHMVTVEFFGIEYSDEKKSKEEGWMPIKVGRKLKYYKIPNTKINKIATKCTCADYRFNWEYQMSLKDSNVGMWRKYKRITPPPARPKSPINPNKWGGVAFKNPKNYMGFCKHVWSLLIKLKKAGYVTG